MSSVIFHEGKDGQYDPFIQTGRGSYVQMSKTSLERLLASYDRAYPEHTDIPRQEVVDAWCAAENAKRLIKPKPEAA